MFFDVLFWSSFLILFGRLLGGENEENEVKIASRREAQKKVDFSESVVLLKEKLTF